MKFGTIRIIKILLTPFLGGKGFGYNLELHKLFVLEQALYHLFFKIWSGTEGTLPLNSPQALYHLFFKIWSVTEGTLPLNSPTQRI